MNDVLILACADGAGSASHAELGSALVVEAAINHVSQRYSGEPVEESQASLLSLLEEAFTIGREALVELSEGEQISLEDLATTFLLAIVSERFTAVAQIGDGAIVGCMDQAIGFETLTTPFHGEYVNQTAFLTQKNYLESTQLSVIEGKAIHIALFSDGFEPVAIKYGSNEPAQALFAGLFRLMNETPSPDLRYAILEGLLTGERIAAVSDDDKTLVLATSSATHKGAQSDATEEQ